MIAVSAAALVFTALTGGVAAAAFAKAIGAVFCGEPRSEKAANAGEVSMCMRMPVVMLFLASFALMIALPFALDFVGKNYFPIYVKEFQRLSQLTSAVAFFSCCAVALAAVFTGIHKMLVCKSGQRVSITWDCGYAKPSAKMEYTATSFSRSIVDFFGFLLRPERKTVPVKEVFPENASIEENIEDGGISRFWQPVFSLFGKAADKIHVLQSGSLHFYLLVLVITLLAMLGFAVMKGN